jgi:hypothetical protein
MAFQTYIVNCRPPSDLETIKSVAMYIRSLKGLILMATQQGAMVAGFDDSYLERVKTCRSVDFVGAVTFNPRGIGARELHRVFTEHLALQIQSPAQE